MHSVRFVAAIVLYLAGRLSAQMLGAGLLDLILCALFVTAYFRTPRTPPAT